MYSLLSILMFLYFKVPRIKPLRKNSRMYVMERCAQFQWIHLTRISSNTHNKQTLGTFTAATGKRVIDSPLFNIWLL